MQNDDIITLIFEKWDLSRGSLASLTIWKNLMTLLVLPGFSGSHCLSYTFRVGWLMSCNN